MRSQFIQVYLFLIMIRLTGLTSDQFDILPFSYKLLQVLKKFILKNHIRNHNQDKKSP
jgi:hypothetical protein